MDIIDKARKLLSDFVKEEVCQETPFEPTVSNKERKDFIINHLEELLDFSFWNIKNKEKYFYSDLKNKDDIDGDRTKISYIIYCLVWNKELNIDFENYLIDGDHPNSEQIYFSGDTICTFNTLFGKKNISWFLNQDFSKVVDRNKIPDDFINVFDDKELKKINAFRLKYQTIPNFYPLPCKTLPNSNTSINSYRGNYKGWKDFFDTFISELDTSLNSKTIDNNTFQKLLYENKFFFNEKITTDKFVKLFYLEPFSKMKYSIETKTTDRYDKTQTKKYKTFAIKFINDATRCIDERKKTLKTVLLEKINLIF